MSPEMLLVAGAALLVFMFLFNRVFPEKTNPCHKQTPEIQAHVSQILDKMEGILDKIEMDLHKNNIEDAAIETRIDTMLLLAEHGLCEQYITWHASIERDIERTARDYQVDSQDVWTMDEINSVLARLESIIAPLASPTNT